MFAKNSFFIVAKIIIFEIILYDAYAPSFLVSKHCIVASTFTPQLVTCTLASFLRLSIPINCPETKPYSLTALFHSLTLLFVYFIIN